MLRSDGRGNDASSKPTIEIANLCATQKRVPRAGSGAWCELQTAA